MARGLRVALTHIHAWPDVHRGAERYVHELAATLKHLGHAPQILTTSRNPRSYEVLDVPVRALPVRMLTRPRRLKDRDSYAFAGQSLRHLLGARIDVWHSNSLYDGAASALAAKLRPGLRTIYSSHGPIHAERFDEAPRGQALRWALRNKRILVMSQPAVPEITPFTKSVPTVVSPGVDTDFFTPGGMQHPTPVILYVGTLRSARKNVATLVEAAALAAAREPALELWVAGDESAPPDDLPEALRPRLRMLGHVEGESLRDLYRSAWVTALVSHREVFGMTIVEGLACGTPAIALDDGWGPAQILGQGGGVLTQDGPQAVADALLAGFSLSTSSGIVDVCRGTAERYDWKRAIGPRVVEVYESGV